MERKLRNLREETYWELKFGWEKEPTCKPLSLKTSFLFILSYNQDPNNYILIVKTTLLSISGSESHKAALRLLAVTRLINQAVGDALSGLLLVEAILQHKNWSIQTWSELYQDLPSRQLKVCLTVFVMKRVYYL